MFDRTQSGICAPLSDDVRPLDRLTAYARSTVRAPTHHTARGDLVRMKFAYLLSGALLSAAITFASPSAQAQAHDLYFAQTGAALTYSFAETRVLYNAMSTRFYDANVVSETLEDLKRALASAERNTERAMARLPKKMKKFAPKLARLKKAIGRGEQSLSRLETDIEEQTAPDLDSPTELGEPLNGKKGQARQG